MATKPKIKSYFTVGFVWSVDSRGIEKDFFHFADRIVSSCLRDDVFLGVLQQKKLLSDFLHELSARNVVY